MNSSFWRRSLFFWLSLVLFALAILTSQLDKKTATLLVSAERIENQIHNKINQLEDRLGLMAENFQELKEDQGFWTSNALVENLLEDPDFVYFAFLGDSLVFWTDNSIIQDRFEMPETRKPVLISFSNFYGLGEVYQVGIYQVIGVIPLQYRFPINNEYLSNRLLLSGIGRDRFEISESAEADLNVTDKKGNFLFGLKSAGPISKDTFLWYLTMLLFTLGIMALLGFLLGLLALVSQLWPNNWWLVAFLADLALVKWFMKITELPAPFYDSRWFEPFVHPVPFLESRGDTMITLICILFFAVAWSRYFKLYPDKIKADRRRINPRVLDSFAALGWIMVMLSWLGLIKLWEYTLSHRTDVLEVHKVLSLDAASLWDLVLLVAAIAAFVLISYKICKELVAMLPANRFGLMALLVGLVTFSVTRYMGVGPSYLEIASLFAIIALAGVILYRGEMRIPQIGVVLLIVLFSLFLMYYLHQYNQEKQNSIQTEMIEGLSNEHDPIAEMLLRRLETEIFADSSLIDLILDPSVKETAVGDYIKNNRLGLYWNRYNINVNVCDSINLLYVLDNKGTPCLDFYNSIIENEGQALGLSSHFYYRDNFDGIVLYLGVLPIFSQDSSYCFHLIISAESILGPEGLGYPDVLIAGEDRLDSNWEAYSYAKYRDCQLISRSGEYSYSSTCESYPSAAEQITHFEANNFDHWIYQVDERSIIVLSKPKIRWLDYVVSFSYLFVGLYLIWLVIAVLLFIPKRFGPLKRADLKVKIQITLVGILVVSFVLIGGGMYYFIVHQYDNSNLNSISEKAQSVLIEVQHKLEFEDQLSPDWQADNYPSLQALLIKFSYVFNTDINIFDPNGKLLASSRAEVFKRNLTGRQMHPKAYYQMRVQDQIEYVHREKIGEMGYWSAYVPFYNGNNQLLAYLNLPYFSKQTELRREISNFMVAMLNGYFLLIFFAVVVAVVLGNQVTKPLRLLQERFSKMQLGGSNTQIAYHKNDEIGGLVKAYNNMVIELADSADRLARSERESAWREMAKQIAHEIKNPLTPMKLSVQHLKRSWDDRIEDWDAYLDRVTNTMVEQIDALTAIANEFSQFAQMPRANRQKIDLVSKIQGILALFKEHREGQIAFDHPVGGPIYVYMDKEQLVQVVNNLVSNAIQSIPAGREPIIKVGVETKNEAVWITVADNGLGISAATQEKLFQPNFTTKTSGMGLGLAIAKNIIKNSDGKIWFETELNKGSIFYIELPLHID